MTDRLAFQHPHDIREIRDALLAADGNRAGGHMRRQDQIVRRHPRHRHHGIVRAQRFVGVAIDRAAAELAVGQRAQHVVLDHDARSAAMGEIGAALHLREEIATDGLIVFRQVRQQTADIVAAPRQFLARDVGQAEVLLHRTRQRAALGIKHLAAEALEPARQLGADLAEAKNADRALIKPVDLRPLRPVESKIVFVATLRRHAPVAGLVGDVDQLADMFAEAQHLHQHMFGHQHAGPHRHRRHRNAGFLRRREIDVPALRPEPLDQPQLLAGRDEIGVDHAGPLADQEFTIRQQGQHLVLARRAAHDDIELGRGRLERHALMHLAAIRQEQCLVAHRRVRPVDSVRVEDFLIVGEFLADRIQFGLGRLVGIGRRRQRAEFHQAGHQQQPRLGRGEIAAADEAVAHRREALVVAAADAHHRHAAMHRLEHHLVARRGRHHAVGRQALDHETGERIVGEVVLDLRDEIDLARRILGEIVGGVAAVLDDGDLRDRRFEQFLIAALDPHLDLLDRAAALLHARHFGRHARDVHVRQISVLRHRQIGQYRIAVVAGRTDDAAVTAGRDIAARPRVGLLHIARRENLLLLDQHHAGAVLAAAVVPDAGFDVVDRVDDVLRPVIADLAVRPLRRVAGDRQRGVEQQIEPVDRLLDARRALRPHRADIVAVVEHALHRIDDARERRTRRHRADVIRLVREEVVAARFRRDIALADILALGGRQTLGVTGRRHDAIEVDVRARRDQVAETFLVNTETVDLLERPRAVRIECLARALDRRERIGAFFFPRPAIGLTRHIRQRKHAVFRRELHLEHRLVIGVLALLVKFPALVDITVRGGIEIGRVLLHRMRAELLDIHRHRRGNALRAQHVETLRRPVGVVPGRQTIFRARLVAGDERRAVLDCRVRPGKMRDARSRHHTTLAESCRINWSNQLRSCHA